MHDMGFAEHAMEFRC